MNSLHLARCSKTLNQKEYNCPSFGSVYDSGRPVARRGRGAAGRHAAGDCLQPQRGAVTALDALRDVLWQP